MSNAISLEQMVDFHNGTYYAIRARKPAMTYVKDNYDFHNEFWRAAEKQQGGTRLEGRVSLGDEGNAQHTGIWEDDTLNIKNITKRYEVPWVYSRTNMSWNIIEQDLNSGKEQIFDTIENKYDNMCREWVDDVLDKIWLTPANADDENSPHGISAWLCLGTDDSLGGWTGYRPKYGDGTSYNVGNLTSSASVNPRWAGYYADHNGNLDDSFLDILNRAFRKLDFRGPSIPKPLDFNTDGYTPKFALYTNDNVLGTISQFYAKSDDQMGHRINDHYGVPHFKNIPFLYVPNLNNADTNRYGTDPVFGINHQWIYPVVQTNNNWKLSKPVSRAAANQHNIYTVYGDLLYAVFCKNRRYAGFLISQQ